MHTASFESIVKTILIILLFYFGFKIFIKWFGPRILKYFLNKIGNKVQQQFNQPPNPAANKKGDVVIDKKPKKGRGSNKNVGEYIDYEEID
ncbi:DUF4834 domain-containing protein [Antarcticibacterium arcticum]|uniref:DUF4834 domain-containing protein n=1 Tax=Antarcticibacterium arcticum TaxID=2585771 RepID=A0A5B8YKE0_9FLAO|nr:DUF4834 domain-containing protein [Antarcticibacterium arcticum]QED36846.1 DUF4834 domain-containing protein [Antarcticibacterium arcticum]